jgi:hypothetical protein
MNVYNDIIKYENLHNRWKGVAQTPNISQAIKSGILWGIAFYIFEGILYLFIGFIFLAIFGSNLYDFLSMAMAVGVAIFSATQDYKAQKSDYEFYTTTDISKLRKEEKDLGLYTNWYLKEHKEEMMMRAVADMREQQMREAVRMKNLKEEELKLQLERNSHAQQQNLYTQQQIELEKNTQEIEREKLYHLRKIREDMQD